MSFISPVPFTGCVQASRFHLTSLHILCPKSAAGGQAKAKSLSRCLPIVSLLHAERDLERFVVHPRNFYLLPDRVQRHVHETCFAPSIAPFLVTRRIPFGLSHALRIGYRYYTCDPWHMMPSRSFLPAVAAEMHNVLAV